MKPEVSNETLTHSTNNQRGVSVYGRDYVFEVSQFLTSNGVETPTCAVKWISSDLRPDSTNCMLVLKLYNTSNIYMKTHPHIRNAVQTTFKLRTHSKRSVVQRWSIILDTPIAFQSRKWDPALMTTWWSIRADCFEVIVSPSQKISV